MAKGKKIPPIVFSPADFLGQKVIVHGRASNRDGRAWLTGPGWEIEVLRGDVWSDGILGAQVALAGVICKDPHAARLQIKQYRVRRDGLEGQVNRHVELRGRALDQGGRWFLELEYNWQNVLVENMNRLVAAHAIPFGATVEVRGVLRKEQHRDEIDNPNCAKMKEQYIVREASYTVVDDFLPIERVQEPCPWSIGAGH